MISIKVRGRLGNQLFQYATVRAFQLKYYPDEELNFDFRDLRKEGLEEVGFKDALIDFNVTQYKSNEDMGLSFAQKAIVFFHKATVVILCSVSKHSKEYKRIYYFEHKFSKIFNYYGFYPLNIGYLNFKETKYKNKLFLGNFESNKFFNNIKDVILEEFEPIYPKEKKNEALYKAMYETESVCITIRRGDFFSNEQIKSKHYVCTPEYFVAAIDKARIMINNPTFFVFSDDVVWVKENIQFPTGTQYEEGNDAVWEKLRLMYSCKHFIISNSSFSWWAQYLSVNTNKIVIAPSRWKNFQYKDDEKWDVCEDSWTYVDV